MFICKVLLNFVVEMGVPEILATTLSELKMFEYLDPPLKKNRLIPNKMASNIAILDFPILLNIIVFSDLASIIILSIKEIKLCLI